MAEKTKQPVSIETVKRRLDAKIRNNVESAIRKAMQNDSHELHAISYRVSQEVNRVRDVTLNEYFARNALTPTNPNLQALQQNVIDKTIERATELLLGSTEALEQLIQQRVDSLVRAHAETYASKIVSDLVQRAAEKVRQNLTNLPESEEEENNGQ